MSPFSPMRSLLVCLGVCALLVAGCSKKGPVQPEKKSPEASATVGESGGTIEVINQSSPLYGAKVEIPAGALDHQTTISIWSFIDSTLRQQIGDFGTGTKYFGGLEIRADGGQLLKPIAVTLANTFGATSTDQLLVGQATNYDGTPPLELVYRGTAHMGSPISFNVPQFGNFAVLSPAAPLGIISGHFLTQTGGPVLNGAIATSFSRPFIAITDNLGYYEIPAGPAGSAPAVLGIPPPELMPQPPTATNGLALETLPMPPIPIPQVQPILGPNVTIDILNFPETEYPEPCQCDQPPTLIIVSPDQKEHPFKLSPGQSIRTYLSGSSGTYGGQVSPWPNILEIYMALWTQTLGITSEVIFWTADSNIASVGSTTGLLKGNTPGQTVEHTEVTIIESKSCPDGSVTMCRYKLLAIPVDVTVQTNATTYIAVGPYFLTFGTASAAYFPIVDQLVILLEQQPYGTEFPGAGTTITNASTVSIGSAVRCDPQPCLFVIQVEEGLLYGSGSNWTGEGAPQFDLVFTRLELRAGGLLSGTVSGTAFSAGDIYEPARLEGVFKDIPVMIVPASLTGRTAEQQPVE